MLTGKKRFRKSIRGKLILQVQYVEREFISTDLFNEYYWRDATIEDFKINNNNMELKI